MEAQETNIDLSDFKIPKIYIKGRWKEFPNYRINRDGSKVYNVKKKKYSSIGITEHSTEVSLADVYGNWFRYAINTLIWFTFEYDNLDLSECKPICYNYKYYPRYLINNNGTIIFDTETKKVLKQTLVWNKPKHKENSTATQHYMVKLHLDSKLKTVYVHQLVKWTYKGGPETELKPPIIDPTVDHKDGNGLNNDITNLQWLSRGFNASKGVSGSSNGMAIINSDVARQICIELQQEDLSISYIAREFNVNRGVVKGIYSGVSWKGISMKYMPFPKRKPGCRKKVGNI